MVEPIQLRLVAKRLTPVEIGDRVFAQLTAEEKEGLARAMVAASESGWGDGTDTLYGDLGDAGLAVPVRRGEPVTDKDLRRMCAILEEARRFPRTGDGDWRSLLGYCFGYENRVRFVDVYAAAGVTG